MKNDSNESEKVGERVRIFKRGTTWYANYQFNERQQRQSLSTDNKKTAIRKALKLDRQLADGELPTKVETATITEAIAAYREYLTAEQRSPKTRVKYWFIFDFVLALAVSLRRTSLSQLDQTFLDKYRSARSKTCSPRTIYTESVVIRQLVKFALTRRMVPHDPLLGLKLKKPKPTPQPYFDDEQVEQILSRARTPYDALFLLLAETGMRIGEATWLSWNDVDLKNNVIHVRAKDDWRPKTCDERAIPISQKLKRLLENHPHRGRWVLTAKSTTTHPSTDRQIDERRALVALKRILAHLKLPGKLHSFRHSFISRCLTRGIEESVVRSWVGHVDPTIMRLYTHISSRVSQDRIQLLGAAEAHNRSAGGKPQQQKT